MMLVGREKMITTFKVLSIALLAFMILDFYSTIAKEITGSKFENNELEYSLNIQKSKSSSFGFAEEKSICEQIEEEKLDSKILFNRTVYYSLSNSE